MNIPFGKGNTERKGIVVGLSKETDYDPQKMKELLAVETGVVPIRTQMICLAFWMKDRYATTMNQALKTVLPVKAKVTPREERVIVSLKPKNEIRTLLVEAEKKKYRARIRALPGTPGKRRAAVKAHIGEAWHHGVHVKTAGGKRDCGAQGINEETKTPGKLSSSGKGPA